MSTAKLDLSTAITVCQKIRNTSVLQSFVINTHTVIHYCKVQPHHWSCVICRMLRGSSVYTRTEKVWILTWTDWVCVTSTTNKPQLNYTRLQIGFFCSDTNERSPRIKSSVFSCQYHSSINSERTTKKLKAAFAPSLSWILPPRCKLQLAHWRSRCQLGLCCYFQGTRPLLCTIIMRTSRLVGGTEKNKILPFTHQPKEHTTFHSIEGPEDLITDMKIS